MNMLVEQEEVKALDVFTSDDLVIVQFALPVAVFAMTAEQALGLAKIMTEAAHYIALMGDTDGKVH